MATTNITHIGTSQTVSDLKPLSTAENIVNYSSAVSGIALLVTAATIAISPTVANISQGSVTSLVTANYAKIVTPTDFLPFMLTITNIGIDGYSPSNPPGIGVQVIGFSNYIL